MDEKTCLNDLDAILELAAKWQNRANQLITSEERRNQQKLKQLILNPLDKAFLTKLIDQCFRSQDKSRIADQITYLLKRSSFPDFFSIWENLLMWLFMVIGRHFPRFTVPLVIKKIRNDSGKTVIQGELKAFSKALKELRKKNIRLNLTRLVPLSSGQTEAEQYFKTVIQDLKHSQIDYISIKITSLCTQLNPFSFEENQLILVEKLKEIFKVAKNQVPSKFVNLDIENSTDIEITKEAFKGALNCPALLDYSAGIAIQAYLPQSMEIMEDLSDWAIKRCERGGNPVKIRIVKGSNLEKEKIDASLNNWSLATFESKIQTDANFKMLVDYGLQKNRFKSVRLGIATHNIFELAFGYYKAKQAGAENYVDLEMLYGVAGHVQKAIREDTENLVLYAPVATDKEFINSIGYLIRRLDENTAEDNFLRYSIGLAPGTSEWNILKDLFISSCKLKTETPLKRHIRKSRFDETFNAKSGTFHLGKFDNEPLTDWSIPQNREWANSIRKKWKGDQERFPIAIAKVIGEEKASHKAPTDKVYDRSSEIKDKALAEIEKTCSEDLFNASQIARADSGKWHQTTLNERHEILSRVAHLVKSNRADLIGAVAASSGITIIEGDREISKSIDLIEYYPHSLKPFLEPRNLECRGKGFGFYLGSNQLPISNACNGIVAALAAGNSIIVLPTLQTALPVWLLCQCFWDAGISKEALQFLPGFSSLPHLKEFTDQNPDFILCLNEEIFESQHPSIGYQGLFLTQRRGNNSIIMTAVSDRDEAIRNIIHSAFLNGGQSISSVNTLILENEVFEDSRFKQKLVDAAKSFKTGSVWDFENRSGALNTVLENHEFESICRLKNNESWALQPVYDPKIPQVWVPGIKWNSQSDSLKQRTIEKFPILTVCKAQSFEHAIQIANQLDYSSTAGLECLDKRKQEFWKSRVKAGLLVINRPTVDTYVLRQPSAGWENLRTKSAMKSGGPNFITQFLDFNEIGSPAEIATKYDRPLLRLAKRWMRKTDKDKFKEYQFDIQKTARAMNSYLFHAKHLFRMEKDFFHLRGQDNIVRYQPIGKMVIRVHREDSLFDILARVSAARIAKCQILISLSHNLDKKMLAFLKIKERRIFLRSIRLISQSDEQLVELLNSGDCIRFASPTRVSQTVVTAALERGVGIIASPVLMEGRIEMLNYYQSQVISHNYHRYGNLGARAFDQTMDSVRITKV